MGSASSKAGKAAAGAAKRQYPQRVPPNMVTKTSAPSHQPPAPAWSKGPETHPEPSASQARDAAVNDDARDPDFAASLREIGPVQTNPTPSFSSQSQTSSPLSSSGTVEIPTPASASSSPSPNFRNNPRDAIVAPQATSPHQTVFPRREAAAQNPALRVLEARARLAREQEEELEGIGRAGAPGQRFLDVMQIKQVLLMRDVQARGDGEIERALRLADGAVAKLGRRGTVGMAS